MGRPLVLEVVVRFLLGAMRMTATMHEQLVGFKVLLQVIRTSMGFKADLENGRRVEANSALEMPLNMVLKISLYPWMEAQLLS